MLLNIFVISLDHNKSKVDLCPHLLRFHLASSAAGTHHFDQVAVAVMIMCNFWHLNVRILDLERLLLYHQ